MRPYEELKQAIEQGGSVLINGQHYTTLESLPSKADLAAASGDGGEVEKVRAEYEAKIAALQAERDKLAAKDGGKGK